MVQELTQEIDLGGTIYISSKRAAEISGYAQDYIGQLARSGQIEAKRISGLWYVLESSLSTHKEKSEQYVPVPPKGEMPTAELEASISFDGKDYVSAQRGAKITGYSSDYVGQLAREGKVLSRQIGNRWYVDREGLVEHKKYNDSLLAAVQTDSVGLQRENFESASLSQEQSEPHFTYLASDVEPLMPEKQSLPTETQEVPDEISQEQAQESTEEINQIPIRVVGPRIERPQTAHISASVPIPTKISSNVHRVTVVGLVIVGILILGGGSIYLLQNSPQSDNISATVQKSASSNIIANNAGILAFVQNLFSKELYYTRN